MKGKRTCMKHGGKTPSGPDSPHWKTGKQSAHRPIPLDEVYRIAKSDPDLMRYQHDAALYEAMRRNLTQRLDLTKPIPVVIEKRLIDLGEALRKIKEAEQRRMAQLRLNVTMEQHRRAMTIAADIVVRVLNRNADQARQILEKAGVAEDIIDRVVAPVQWQREMQHEMRLAMARTPAIVVDVLPAAEGAGE